MQNIFNISTFARYAKIILIVILCILYADKHNCNGHIKSEKVFNILMCRKSIYKFTFDIFLMQEFLTNLKKH